MEGLPSSAGPEPVAHAAHREDVARFPRIGLNLLPQVPDVDVDRPRVAVVRAAPEPLEKHLAAEDVARLSSKRPEQLELEVGELHRLPLDIDRTPAEVDCHPV